MLCYCYLLIKPITFCNNLKNILLLQLLFRLNLMYADVCFVAYFVGCVDGVVDKDTGCTLGLSFKAGP